MLPYFLLISPHVTNKCLRPHSSVLFRFLVYLFIYLFILSLIYLLIYLVSAFGCCLCCWLRCLFTTCNICCHPLTLERCDLTHMPTHNNLVLEAHQRDHHQQHHRYHHHCHPSLPPFRLLLLLLLLFLLLLLLLLLLPGVTPETGWQEVSFLQRADTLETLVNVRRWGPCVLGTASDVKSPQ